MISNHLRTLDDATALHLLAAMARAQRLVPVATPPNAAELRAALTATFGEPPSPAPSRTTEADVARAALVLAAEDPETAEALGSLLDHGNGTRSVLGTGSLRDIVTTAAISLLKSHLKIAVEVPGALSFHLEKPPAPDSAVLDLVRALQGALPPPPAPALVSAVPVRGPPPLPTSATSLFVARAPADEEHAARLRAHLAPWLNRGDLQWWSEDDLQAGSVTAATTSARLDAADIILLLVSADFLHSPPHLAQVTHALARHRNGTVHLVPVLLCPCAWEETALAPLEPLPRNRRPVTTWPFPDEAWLSVVQDLAALLPSRAR
jgi:hypothetical protein